MIKKQTEARPEHTVNCLLLNQNLLLLVTNLGFTVYDCINPSDDLPQINAKSFRDLFGAQFEGEAQCFCPDFAADGNRFLLALNKADQIELAKQTEHVY